MKKIIVSFAFLFFALSGYQVLAQNGKNGANDKRKTESRIERRTGNKEMRVIEVNNVSLSSLSSFESHFGMNSDVKWVRSNHFDEATFIRNNQVTTAYFDFEGNLKGTSTVKSFSDLPLRGQKIIEKKYAGFSAEFVIYYEFNKLSDAQMLLFNTQYSDSKNYFVQMSKGNELIVLQVTPVGQVFFFKKVR